MFKKKKDYHFEIVRAEGVDERFIRNRDDLIRYLEEENVKVMEFHTTGIVEISQKDEDDQVNVTVEFQLPFSDGTSIEDLVTVFEDDTMQVKKIPKGSPKKQEGDSKHVSVSLKPSSSSSSAISSSGSLTKALSKVIVLVAIGAIAAVGIMVVPGLMKPSYESLIQKGSYVEAVQAFPDKREEVEALLFSKEHEGIPALEVYVSEIGSKSAELDLAYLKQEYEKVISLKAEANTPIRKTEVAVSYYKSGELAKAFELSQEVDSPKLKEMLLQSMEADGVEALKRLDVAGAKGLQELIHSATLKRKIESVERQLQLQEDLTKQLKDSSISEERRTGLERQLKSVESRLEKIKQGELE